MHVASLAAWLVLLTPIAAHAQSMPRWLERLQPRTYHDVKRFLLDALESPAGIDAILEGDFARQFARQFQAEGILRARSSVTERSPDGRCGRVETKLTQEGARIGGEVRPLAMTMRVALCVDGQPWKVERAPVEERR